MKDVGKEEPKPAEPSPPAAPDLSSVVFVDESRGWAVGDGGTILASTDGGVSWKTQSSGTEAGLRSVQFLDARQGWAVGDSGTILASTDGGVSWKTQSSGTKKLLSSVQFLDPRQGWAVGQSGTILASTDGGVSWKTQSSGAKELVLSSVSSFSTPGRAGRWVRPAPSREHRWRGELEDAIEWHHGTA